MNAQLTKVPPQGAPVASPANAKKSVRQWMESDEFKLEMLKVLPRHMTPDRMARIALTAAMKNPKILQCTVESIMQCMLTCSQFGLEPDGRRAHLIPFEDRNAKTIVCTLIIDYKGLVELAIRSGKVAHLHADIVREGDLFEFSIGEIKEHVPWFLRRDADKPAEVGRDIAAYAFARMKDGSTAVAVLSIEEIYAIRDGSQGWKAFEKGITKQSPWDPQNWVSEQEMKKKTALRRLTKMLPLSPEFRDAIDIDDDEPQVRMVNVTPKTSFLPEPTRSDTGTAPTQNTQQLPPPVDHEGFNGPPSFDEDRKAPAEKTNAQPPSAPQPPVQQPSVQQQQPPTHEPTKSDSPMSPQEQLEMLVAGIEGASFATFKTWAVGAGFMKPDSVAESFADLGVALCTKLLKNPAGLKVALVS